MVEVIKEVLGGNGFNSSDSGSNTLLGKNLKGLDGGGILYMGSSAKLNGEIAYGNHSYGVTVLFSE